MRLGRDFSCAIVLSSTLDPVVSAEHAELRTENGRVEITDLASTNGTFVNGQPVKGAQVLEDQDVVELGCPGVRILFVERGAALNAKSIAW
jgi:pSer/pThr/pTyr-binding forkhead associated (FHA) protein